MEYTSIEDKKKPVIGILTTFYDFNSAYSLTSVVENQLISLVKNNYKTVLFVHDNFRDDNKVPEGVELRKVVPRFLLRDYSSHQDTGKDLEEQAEKAYKAIKEHTQDVDIILEHDLIFQGWFLPYCMAIHRLAEESSIKWFHWIHSNPSGRPDVKYPHSLRYTLPKNSKIVYLNNSFLINVAENYGVFPKDVRIVYNALDVRSFYQYHPLVAKLINKYSLLDADLIQTYPVSTPRMVDGKQLKVVIDIFSYLKKIGKSVRLLVANAHANDKREKQIIGEVISHAVEKGLHQGEVIFTSLEDIPDYEVGVPREVVSQLFQLSNLFIFPSISENCSLILLEAMLAGNLLILNSSVPQMKEFGQENALYFRFGSSIDSVNYNNGKDNFMSDVAKIIVSEFETNKPLKARNYVRKNFNYDKMFTNLESLFYEQ